MTKEEKQNENNKTKNERRDGDMKKYFLTTALMGTFIAPAFGADKIITSANTCTVDVLGVSDNNAIANTIATWDLIDYTLNPGQYLNVTETSVDKTTCPAGSYCVGGGYTVETANNSIAQCPTGYPNSANGASADTQCYTACTVATANIAHATAVSGNDYYGTGVDTCGATACETGYHVDGGGLELVEKDPLVPISLTAEGAGYRFVRADGTSDYRDTVDAIPADSVTAPNTWATAYSEGVLYGKASCQSVADPALEYFYNNVGSVGGDITREEFYAGLVSAGGVAKADILMNHYEDLWGDGDFSDDYESFLKKFRAVFSDKEANYQTTDSGQYCYCQMDGFTPTGGTKEIVTSAPWVFSGYDGLADDCADNCASYCAHSLLSADVNFLTFRGAEVGAFDLVETGGICEANTINIDWNPDNGGAHTQNMCTYDGSITIPTPDPVKPGYTFTGWKLLEENK